MGRIQTLGDIGGVFPNQVGRVVRELGKLLLIRTA